jgi:hypothetical protein
VIIKCSAAMRMYKTGIASWTSLDAVCCVVLSRLEKSPNSEGSHRLSVEDSFFRKNSSSEEVGLSSYWWGIRRLQYIMPYARCSAISSASVRTSKKHKITHEEDGSRFSKSSSKQPETWQCWLQCWLEAHKFSATVFILTNYGVSLSASLGVVS